MSGKPSLAGIDRDSVFTLDQTLKLVELIYDELAAGRHVLITTYSTVGGDPGRIVMPPGWKEKIKGPEVAE